MSTKLNLKFKSFSLEIDGEEIFVEKVYNDFKELIIMKNISTELDPEIEITDEPEGEKKSKTKKLPPKIVIEDFNVDGDSSKNIKSFKDFMGTIDDSKLQKRANEFILCVAYYLNKIIQLNEFSEGNIEFAYKYLEQKGRPAHLRQVITNIKNEDGWIEPSSINKKKWTIGRLGESFFENNLIKK